MKVESEIAIIQLWKWKKLILLALSFTQWFVKYQTVLLMHHATAFTECLIA